MARLNRPTQSVLGILLFPRIHALVTFASAGICKQCSRPAIVASVSAAPSFSPCPEQLQPQSLELQRSWFTQWGFAEPGPAPKKVGKAGKGGKGGKAKNKAAVPKSSSMGMGMKTASGFGDAKMTCKAPPDGMINVFRANIEDGAPDLSPDELQSWGSAARRIVESHLDDTGAVLLRGLPMRSAEAFSHFWRGCLKASGQLPALEEGVYSSLGPSSGRDKLAGIDLATNVPPEFLLLCHNEMAYNPVTCGRIALYCVQDAPEGGETILARNSDLNKSLPKAVLDFLNDHGGILYSRTFHDARSPIKPPDSLGSWQEKCALPPTAGKEEAEAFFQGMGFASSQLEWDEYGGLRVSNHHPGVVKDPHTGEDAWWNIVHTGSMKAGDGTPFPKKLVSEVQRTGWEHTYAFKLLPGDWLMLDNMRLQHGRLPYVQSDDPSKKRTLLTVYSSPRRSF